MANTFVNLFNKQNWTYSFREAHCADTSPQNGLADDAQRLHGNGVPYPDVGCPRWSPAVQLARHHQRLAAGGPGGQAGNGMISWY